MSAVVAPPQTREQWKSRVMAFVRAASAEISTLDEEQVPEIARELPGGTTVYVAHTPKAKLEQVVSVALKVQELGLRASPHIVARRLRDRSTLAAALRQLRDGGVTQVLLVAGDPPEPEGEFASTLEVLDSGCLEEQGVERAGVCGHPEGNKAIAPAMLWQALKHKQAYAQRSPVKLHIVTQFSFDAEAIYAWSRELVQHGISLPVHVGIAGPTPLPRLIKFAMQCGVATSMRSMAKNMGAMSKMVRPPSSPEQMLLGLVERGAGEQGSRIVQPHFFAFGGALATARWLRRMADGRFELPANGGAAALEA